MSTRHHAHAVKYLPLVCAAAAFFLISAMPLNAQPRGVGTMNRSIDSRERQIRSTEIDAARQRDPKSVLAEVNEDLSRLQVINGELKEAMSAGRTLDYKVISEASAEIKKRTTRLKNNLAGLPKAEKDEKTQAAKAKDAAFDALLTSLTETVTNFITNPIFSDVGAPDPRLAAKARTDLDGIIELSERVRKSADKLKKTAGQ